MSRNDDLKPLGYGNPPEEHRIKKREVRNPWGRRGKPRARLDFMDEPFELKMDGKAIRVTRDQAIDYALFRAGLAGNVSAAKLLERRRRDRASAVRATAENEGLASEDQRAFERYLERALRERQSGTGRASPSSSPNRGRSEGSGGS